VNSALPVTFIDGSSSSPNNLIDISATSSNMVNIHLNHVGAKIVISKSNSDEYLNVMIKFDADLSVEQQNLIVKAITSNSLCKNGCPSRERVEIKSLLEAIGFDTKAAQIDELKSAAVASNATSDPCEGLIGYYRLSCLYDVKMKGITVEDANIHRMIQAHDDMSVVKRSFIESWQSDDINSANRISKGSHCKSSLFMIIIILVSSTNMIMFTHER